MPERATQQELSLTTTRLSEATFRELYGIAQHIKESSEVPIITPRFYVAFDTSASMQVTQRAIRTPQDYAIWQEYTKAYPYAQQNPESWMLYSRGVVDRLGMALMAFVIEDQSEVDCWFYGGYSVKSEESLRMGNLDGFTARNARFGLSRDNIGTSYFAPLADITQHHAMNAAGEPMVVLLQTDGEDYDVENTDAFLRNAPKTNFYIALRLGASEIGKSPYQLEMTNQLAVRHSNFTIIDFGEDDALEDVYSQIFKKYRTYFAPISNSSQKSEKRVPRFCSQCGKSLGSPQNFCTNCGGRL